MLMQILTKSDGWLGMADEIGHQAVVDFNCLFHHEATATTAERLRYCLLHLNRSRGSKLDSADFSVSLLTDSKKMVLLELPGDFSLDGLRGPERRQRSL
jgi:hypothetical protein